MKDLKLRTAVRPVNAQNGALSKFKPVDSVDLIVNLFEKALNSKGPVIKSKFAADPVNRYAEEAFNIKVSCDDPKHPVDEFYDSINIELSNRRPFVKPTHPLDVANALAGRYFVSGGPSNESMQKIENVLGSIKTLYLSYGKSSYPLDPVNDVVKEMSGTGYFPCEPKHSEKEVIDLIKKSLGPAYHSIKPSCTTDICNDFVADQFGYDRPSVKALARVQDELFDATYQLAYKLTPESTEYINKAKEIDKLKEERNKLQNNLNELNK